MKNKTFIFVLSMLFLAFTSCKDEGAELEPNILYPVIKLEIANITDSGADIVLKKQVGLVTSYKIITDYLTSDLPSGTSDEEALKALVTEKGVVVTAPYSGKSVGLQPDTEYVTVAVGFGASGAPICIDHVVYTTAELPGAISNDNSVGELDQLVW